MNMVVVPTVFSIDMKYPGYIEASFSQLLYSLIFLIGVGGSPKIEMQPPMLGQ